MIERYVCLGGHAVQVIGESVEAEEMFDFMFGDIPDEEFEQLEACFSLRPLPGKGWQVSKDSEQVYLNHSLVDAANFLMGEVVFHLIENNRHYMAIHAALLSDEDGAILLPGESGNGKSSLSIWMTQHHFHYHTDELVLIRPGSLDTRVFTRPFNIKAHGVAAISKLINVDELDPPAARGHFITMIPHRALNPDYLAQPPAITRILFPKFNREGENQLVPLSRAVAGIELMKTNVIARNLPGHGFEQLLDIVKSVPAYRLNYNHFDALPDLLSGIKGK